MFISPAHVRCTVNNVSALNNSIPTSTPRHHDGLSPAICSAGWASIRLPEWVDVLSVLLFTERTTAAALGPHCSTNHRLRIYCIVRTLNRLVVGVRAVSWSPASSTHI